MKKNNLNHLMNKWCLHKFYWLLVLLALVSLSACAPSEDGDSPETVDVLDLNMDIPASLTGGQDTKGVALATVTGVQAKSTGTSCSYLGPDDGDEPFRNGYEMTKFMVSVVASWTCWSDLLIDVSAYVPHDGKIQQTDNQTDDPNYEADEPTHYSVVDDSETQTTIRIYYGYDRDVPPSHLRR